nr:MAG TPA: hypothetical protein [Caudoviricetes sp.]
MPIILAISRVVIVCSISFIFVSPSVLLYVYIIADIRHKNNMEYCINIRHKIRAYFVKNV